MEVEAGDDDAAGAALGKLTEAQIQKGQAVLEQIKAAIGGSGSVLAELSGQFYSFIPTQSEGSLMTAPPIIQTIELLEEKEAKLEFWLRMGFEDLGPEVKVSIPSSSTAAAAAAAVIISSCCCSHFELLFG